MSATNVNRWTEPEWALRYLRERDAIPHRVEGLQVMLELLPPRIQRVLDLGTGDGNTLALVLSAHPDARGVGLDFQEEMLRRARDRFASDERVEVCAHDLDDPLPADLDGFDVVVSSFAIHHLVPDRQRALYGEVLERLVPGGRFVNVEHVASRSRALHERFLHAIGKTPAQDDPSNKLVPVETQLHWLDELGYQDADCFWKWRELAVLAGTKA
ncbi:MAG: class I SAM-dependent methyltransferase [Actinomycetota bacterium]